MRRWCSTYPKYWLQDEVYEQVVVAQGPVFEIRVMIVFVDNMIRSKRSP